MYIKNYGELIEAKNLSDQQLILRKLALLLIEKSIIAVKPENLIKGKISLKGKYLYIKGKLYDLNKYNRIYIVGGGKAAGDMAIALEKILTSNEDILFSGLVIVDKKQEDKYRNIKTKIKIKYGSHPYPDRFSKKNTLKMLKLLKNANRNDLIIVLITGGGSSLIFLPKKGISLNNMIKMYKLLIKSSASIHEVNEVRKQLSRVKGGNLSRYIGCVCKSEVIGLIISDVVGNSLKTVASGPTVYDNSHPQSAIQILKDYKLFSEIPHSITKILMKLVQNFKIEEEDKLKYFSRVNNFLIGNVQDAVDVLINTLKKFDFKLDVLSDFMIGEAREFSMEVINLLKDKDYEVNKRKRFGIIGTGELTITVKGYGMGGRNQEFLASLLHQIKKKDFDFNYIIVSINLDGNDGNSKAMGALVDNHVLNNPVLKSLDLFSYLENNDSNSVFRILKTEIITGPTSCNVNDIMIILINNNNIDEIDKIFREFQL